MASDYEFIREEHLLDYGRKLADWAQDHLANRYSDRTHFIFELLQNAEDALRERGESSNPTSVHFDLQPNGLEVRHFGRLFDPSNVKSICAINESTKRNELTEIGRFGIGFKSVYAFTKRPEVHSGDEHFAIEQFVLPTAVDPRDHERKETLFWLPFDGGDTSAVEEVASALRNLGCERLLFLKSVTEITWALPDGTKGVFLKNRPQPDNDGQIITLIGEIEGAGVTMEENWLLFSRPVAREDGQIAGSVEIAFHVESTDDGQFRIVEVNDSKLVVFFPTEVSTGLGFLIQGPYRTTPSRDNVPQQDEWNRMLVRETSVLLVDSFQALKRRGLLVTDTLSVLPINARRYAEDSMFRPLFDATLNAFEESDVIPAAGGGHVAGKVAKLARGEGIRELFTPGQLGKLVGEDGARFWLAEDITRDRAATLREFLIQHVKVNELTPDSLSTRLTVEFIKDQDDEWIERLYAFLGSQKNLREDLLKKRVPIIRCEDGSHVVPFKGGIPQVFLPSDEKTGFQTVRASVCSSAASLEFLKLIGLDVPDPVDDVIQNVLASYNIEKIERTDGEYETDVERIKAAFKTDSDTGRKKLLEGLKTSRFVRARNAATGEIAFLKPNEVYRGTKRIVAVFEGVEGAWIVDDQVSAFKGEPARDLLQACGALDVIRTRYCSSDLDSNEKESLRRAKAAMVLSSDDVSGDTDCPELEGVLNKIRIENEEPGKRRAIELWALLRDTLRDRRETYFQGTYSWSYSHRSWSSEFPATWVRRLRDANWIPVSSGEIKRPTEVCVSEVCEEIADLSSPFLVQVLGFRAEAIKELAEKEGIDLEVLNLLKRHNVTADALRKIFGKPSDEEECQDDETNGEQEDDSNSTENGGDGGNGGQGGHGGHGGGGAGGGGGNSPGKKSKGGGQRTSFQTYVGVEGEDPDHGEGSSQEERMALEEVAVVYILECEPSLQRTPTHNPGFDLYEGESLEFPVRFVEVKALKGEWNRPVAMSEMQFQMAETERERFFLYVVEHAADPSKRQLYRVADPAGIAKYFCFDSGWRNVAKHQTP